MGKLNADTSDQTKNNEGKFFWKKVEGVTVLKNPLTFPVYVRSDVADSLTDAFNEISSLGGSVVSSGAMRALSDYGRSGTSATSLHYLGLAVDLFVYGGMQNPENDSFIVIKDGGTAAKPQWRVYCKTENTDIKVTTLKAAVWVKGLGVEEKTIEGRFIDATEILKKHGWEPISVRKEWKNSYISCEWWHFQNTKMLLEGSTTFKSELLKLYEETEVNTHFKMNRSRYLNYIWNDGYFDN
mgnify:CR=1 FL=1